jgi:hypothetical protein
LQSEEQVSDEKNNKLLVILLTMFFKLVRGGRHCSACQFSIIIIHNLRTKMLMMLGKSQREKISLYLGVPGPGVGLDCNPLLGHEACATHLVCEYDKVCSRYFVRTLSQRTSKVMLPCLGTSGKTNWC